MVWAKTRMVIRDYIFEPRKDLYLLWSGKIPAKVYLEILELIKDVFSVPESHIIEMVFDWEKKGNRDKFKIGWRVIKEYDVFSYLRVDVNLSGKIENGIGSLSIAIKPRFFTEYPQDNIFQQTIIYEIYRTAWHKFHYEKQRFKYMEESRILVMEFHRRLKELLNAYQ